MKFSSLQTWCLGIGLGAALTFSLMAMLRARDFPGRLGARGVEPPTAEQAALNETYLTLYSHKKFAPLLALLPPSMPPDQVRRLSELLAEREVSLANAKPKADEAAMPLQAYLEAQEKVIREKIILELGPDLADRVDRYIRTLPQRLMVGELNQILVYRGIGLNADQIEQLCQQINRRDLMVPRHPTADDMNAFITNKESADREVIAAARTFLSSDQLSVLNDELNLQVAQLRMNRENIRRAANLRP